MVPLFKNVGEKSLAQNYCPVSRLSMVNKIFEKLVNSRHVDHFEKFTLFHDFQFVFRTFFQLQIY